MLAGRGVVSTGGRARTAMGMRVELGAGKEMTTDAGILMFLLRRGERRRC